MAAMEKQKAKRLMLEAGQPQTIELVDANEVVYTINGKEEAGLKLTVRVEGETQNKSLTEFSKQLLRQVVPYLGEVYGKTKFRIGFTQTGEGKATRRVWEFATAPTE